MIEISSKFKPGDNLYRISQVPILELLNCDFCAGSGQVSHKGTPLLCPKCKGKELTAKTGYSFWEVDSEPLTITSISITYRGPKKYSLNYKISGNKSSGENLFLSKEEAVNKCNELNNALISNTKNNTTKNYEGLYNFVINNKFDIGDIVYTVKKDFKRKNDLFFKLSDSRHTIDYIKVTIYDEKSFDIRYKLGKLFRQESRVFSGLDEAKIGCKTLNKS